MLSQLSKEKYRSIRPITESNPYPIIQSVLQLKQDGKIFTDDINAPEVVFVLHKSGFSSVYASQKNNMFSDFVYGCDDVPQYFHIYDAPQCIVSEIAADNNRFNTRIRTRIQLRYTGNRILDKISMPYGYSVEKINASNINSLAVFDLSIENKFWASRRDFLDNGFGFCVLNDAGQPISICYAASLANGFAEIDVATLEGYRQKGYAKAATISFINHCLENNIVANWDCFEENKGSLITAQNLKFAITHTYRFLSVFKKK